MVDPTNLDDYRAHGGYEALRIAFDLGAEGVIREVNARLAGAIVNAFDVLSVRRVHAISEETRPEFVHVPKFGSPQYSDAFVDWLIGEHERDSEFFTRAKAKYLATRPRRRASTTS